MAQPRKPAAFYVRRRLPGCSDEVDAFVESPVFLHALFRTGSTYLWSAYRHQQAFQCYYEPFHEQLGDGGHHIAMEQQTGFLRHPPSPAPYFAEYELDANGRHLAFVKELSYDLGYLEPGDDAPELHRYMHALRRASRRRPLFQPCRSTLRMGWLRRHVGGVHVYLARDPRAQWSSFLSYAEPYYITATLMMLAKNGARRLTAPLVRALALPYFNARRCHDEYNYYRYRVLPRLLPAHQYAAVYYMGLISLLAAVEHCDIILDMDAITHEPLYRQRCRDQLTDAGIGVDLHDCRMPGARALPMEPDALHTVERSIERLLAASVGPWLYQVIQRAQRDVFLSETLRRRIQRIVAP